jgi:hypothetical protein
MPPYDVKRDLRSCYAPKNTDWALVDVPDQQFVAMDGRGDPRTAPAYAAALEALYGVAYTVKFASKGAGQDFVVGPLEGLWWSDDPAAFTADTREAWQWRLLISMPAWVTATMVDDARDTALAKKKAPAIADVRLTTLSEGRCAQVLHHGPYTDEAPTLARLHDEWLAEHGLAMSGIHHEVYLTDARRTAPEKLRTVLRQPVREKAASGS